ETLRTSAYPFDVDIFHRVLSQWRVAQKRWSERGKSGFGHDLQGSSSDELRSRALEDGILVEPQSAEKSRLIFLHRTFQEYLAAQFLAELARQEGWRHIEPFIDGASWDPDWRQVVLLCAGMLDDAKPLLDCLTNDKTDDVFRHRLGLAAECLVE